MIIGAVADQVIAELGYISSEKRLDRRNVILRMDAVWRSLLMNLLYDGTQMPNGEWQSKVDSEVGELPDACFISRTAPVALDSIRNRYYATVPSEFVTFKNMNGIRWVAPAQDPTDGFICQMNGASGAYSMLESNQLGGAKGYEIEGLNLYLNNIPLNVYSNLLITYLPALTGLKETDFFPLPGEIAKKLLDDTVKSFVIQMAKPEDKTEDNLSE